MPDQGFIAMDPPASISYSGGNAGATINVSCAAITSPSAVYYAWESQIDGGAFAEFSRTDRNPNTTFTLPYSGVSLVIRVRGLNRAYPDEHRSNYRTGPAVTIQQAPSTPGSINISSPVNSGGNVTVSWSASSDPNGNLSGYRLECSANGGAWSQVYQGAATSSAQTINASWSTVTFRVRAYDSAGMHSDYRTSGTVTVNTAPTTPSSIGISSPVNSGGTITVSWGASGDAEGNLSGYKLERSASGGSWEQVYQGTATSVTQTVAAGWSTVAFRVRAYDGGGMHSAYRTSSTVTVNTAPTAPATITVPATVKGGSAISVSWGTAADAQNNLEKYFLERRVDDGSWTQVYEGTALSSTQAVTKGWKTIAFRVRARDTGGLYSAYNTSDTRTVINNSAPPAPASISYPDNPRAGRTVALTCDRVTDPDGDTVSYVWESRVDSGNYRQIGVTQTTSVTDTVPVSGVYYQARVKAADPDSAESAYTTGTQAAISYNDPPVLSGSDGNLGDLTGTGLLYTYTVTDDKAAGLAVEIRLDGGVYQTLTVMPGVENTLQISGAEWLRVRNGAHTVTITATDAEGTGDTRTLAFTKNQAEIEIALREPAPSSGRPYRMALNLSGAFPAGSELEVLACNNAFDASPVWEDITGAVRSGHAYIFTNSTRTAESWGVRLRVHIKRGTATELCTLSGLAYAFEAVDGSAAQMAALTAQIENNEQLLDELLLQVIPNLVNGGAQA